ncbi:hypothetical protein, partial [Pseudonocardia alni]|uniref:hypothetical protein n=1 Tax=Pseudonocardia alni TaxID=33907 RepID=UPI0031F9984A
APGPTPGPVPIATEERPAPQDVTALPGGAGARKLGGLVSGPALYLQARRQVQAEGGTTPPLTGPARPLRRR